MARRFITVRRKFSEEVKVFLKSLLSGDSGDGFLVPVKKDNRGWLAQKIDYLSIRLVFFVVVGFFVSSRASMNWALSVATLGTIVLHLLLSKSEKAREKRLFKAERDYLVRSHTYEQLMKMDPGSEFRILLAQVLNGLDGFSEIRPLDSALDHGKFDLVGKFKDCPIVVKCNRYKKENEVCKTELADFVKQLKDTGITRGIFLSTSGFSEWAVDYVHSIKTEGLRIVLVDKVKLLEWIRLSGHPVFPDEEKAKELETIKQMEERRVSLQKREKQNKRLMQTFFMVCAYLTILSLLMRQWLVHWMLYLYFAVAILNLLLGFLFYALYRHTRSIIRESYMLEQFD